MRIVDVCAFYTQSGGGVRTYIEAKLKAASRLGHELIVLAPGQYHEVIRRGDGAAIVTIPAPRLPLDRRYRYFNDQTAVHKALDEWRPDHVEASSPWSSAGMVGRWQGAATRSLVMHCDPLAAYAYRWLGGITTTGAIDRLFGWFWRHLRRLDDMFDLVVCANSHLTDRLRGGGLTKVETIAMGVELGTFSAKFRSMPLRAAILQAAGQKPNATLLVGVGRMAAEKRWDMLIRAVSRIDWPVGLVLIGDGPRRPQLEALAKRNGRILVLPPTTDRRKLARLLASADALVHGCEAETYCMAAAEARASGVPLIVPDRGAARDQLVSGAGLTYESGDERALASAIRSFIESGPEAQRLRATRHSEVRTIDEHFRHLFAHYSRLTRNAPIAAPVPRTTPVLQGAAGRLPSGAIGSC
jgi:alpha-1,6-mannosyltransferase